MVMKALFSGSKLPHPEIPTSPLAIGFLFSHPEAIFRKNSSFKE